MASSVRFHRELYPEEAVRASMEAYAAHGKFELSVDEPYTMVEIEPTAEGLDADHLAREFSNHVLAGAVERKRS